MVNSQTKSLHQMRKESGLTATQIAYHIDVSYPTLRNWERGKAIPDAVKLRNLLALYGYTNDDLDWDIFEKKSSQ